MTDFLLRFVHISDTHLTPDLNYIQSYANYTPMVGVNRLIEEIQKLPFPIDFVLHTGDVAYDPVPEVYGFVRETLQRLNLPIYYVVGNHDHDESVQRVLMGRTEVQLPLHYTTEVNGVQLVFVDSNGPAPIPAGNVTPEQLTWLDGICSSADDRPLVIAIHHNVVPYGIPWLDGYMRTNNGEAFHEIVVKAKHRLKGVFHGHIHQSIDVVRDGVLYSAAASPWCQFSGYPTPENTDVTPDKTAQPGFSVVSITAQQTYIRRHTFVVA